MNPVNHPCKPIKTLVIADCDYQDKPLGGVVSLLRNMLSVPGAGLVELSLVGISFDGDETEGTWNRKVIQGREYRWMPVYVCNKSKEDTKFPLRFRLVAGVKRYLREINFGSYDAIYIHSAETVLALPLGSSPVICHVHGDPLITITRSRFPLLRCKFFVGGYNRIIRRAFDRASGIIWAANACRTEYYRRLNVSGVSRWDKKSEVIYSSVDPVLMESVSEGRPSSNGDVKRIVTVSRLSEVKHIDFLIEVFAEVKKRMSSLEFCIAGEGECEPKLRECAAELGCSDDVRFLGNLSKLELAQVLKTADVFVLASESEAMSLVVLESMAAGVPVVSTRVGDLDVVIDDNTGAIVEGRDVKQFAKAVEGCLGKGKDAYRAACVSTAKKYTAENMRRQIEEYIAQCVR
ncbi:glycosyltransferase family 4 protein [Rubneribacter sp.]